MNSRENQVAARVGACLVLGVLTCATAASWLQPRLETLSTGSNLANRSVSEVVLGDFRRLMANQFMVKADEYFHSGYYPSIFDQAKKSSGVMAAEIREDERSQLVSPKAKEEHEDHDHDAHHDEHEEKEGHEEADFLGRPRDVIEAFGRYFFASSHTHLETKQDFKELLPWLKLAAEMDSSRPDAYVLTSYWLRKELGKVDEAEAFLREGWRINPGSVEIMLELGKLYEMDRKDDVRASNLYEAVLKKWARQHPQPTEADYEDSMVEQALGRMARIEEKRGNYPRALYLLEQLVPLSPAKDQISRQILEMRGKLPPAPKVE